MHDELPHPDVFARLHNCHDRLRRELASLTAATAALLTDHDDPPSIAAVHDAVSYFDRAITRHEEDEEKSLFPRVAHLPELEPTLAALQAEHTSQRDLHDALRSLASTPLDREALTQIDKIARALDRSYALHLAREEQELFPLAARSLAPETLTVIDSEMEARRGGGGRGGGGGGGGGRGGGGGGGGGRGRRD